MADIKTVRVDYEETRYKKGTIDVDLDAVKEWLGSPTTEPTGQDIKEFLEAGDEDEWVTALRQVEDSGPQEHRIESVTL